MQAGRRGKDRLTVRSQAAVRDEERVSRTRSVISEPGSVPRPVELSHTFEVGPRLATQCRRGPNTDVAAVRSILLADPKCDERAIRRKPQRADRRIHEL